MFASCAIGAEPSTRPAMKADGMKKTITKTLEMEYPVHLPSGYGRGEKSPLGLMRIRR